MPDRPAAADQRVHRDGGVRAAGLGALDPQHVRAEIGEDHAAERRRREARDLDHPDPVQRSHQFASSAPGCGLRATTAQPDTS